MLCVIECKNGISVNVDFDPNRIGNKSGTGIGKRNGAVGFKMGKEMALRDGVVGFKIEFLT